MALNDITDDLAPNQLNATLVSGERTLSYTQTITFVRYARLVLPIDGFVFWVRADLLSPAALANVGGLNAVRPGQPLTVAQLAPVIVAHGSFHYATDQLMQPDEVYAKNHVTFTSEVEVEDLNTVGPTSMYIGEFEGLRFAFSRRENFYTQANIYHYRGDAGYAPLDTQLVAAIAGFNTSEAVVSNSLPIWLNLVNPTPYPGLAGFPVPIYPSYLVPDNLPPPYIVAHIEPSQTEAIGDVPVIGADSTHTQLAADTVRFTLYGLRNNQALDFQDYLFRYSLDTDDFGLMDTPIVRDEKMPQVEIGVLAMKKTFSMKVSYYQTRVNDIARQLILSCVPDFIFN